MILFFMIIQYDHGASSYRIDVGMIDGQWVDSNLLTNCVLCFFKRYFFQLKSQILNHDHECDLNFDMREFDITLAM